MPVSKSIRNGEQVLANCFDHFYESLVRVRTMQIEHFHSPPHGSPIASRGPHVSLNGVAPQAKQNVETTPPATTWRALSPEIERWSSRLAAEPEVRPDVVIAARLRLSSGALLTRRAAEETAAAIVRQE
jgi:hypothetical protein